MCVGLQEHPGRDAVLLRGVKCLQLLQTLVDAQVMSVVVLVAAVAEAVRPRVCGAVRLGRPEQVCVSHRPRRAAVSDRLRGDLARCRVTELGCRGFGRREMDELPVSEHGHWNTHTHR